MSILITLTIMYCAVVMFNFVALRQLYKPGYEFHGEHATWFDIRAILIPAYNFIWGIVFLYLLWSGYYETHQKKDTSEKYFDSLFGIKRSDIRE